MGVQLKQNADLSMGLQGTDGDDGAFLTVVLPWNAVTTTTAVLNLAGPVLTRRMIVKDIRHNVDVVAASAVTATVYKAASGVAPASGVALHTSTANLQATVNVPVVLAASTTPSDRDVAAGTRLVAVVSGAVGATGSGSITVTLAPA